MTSKQVGKHGRRHRTRVNVDELYLNGNTGFAMVEFYALLEDSEFVTKVIEIYRLKRDDRGNPSGFSMGNSRKEAFS